MRRLNAFARELEIPEAAVLKSIELMRKANLADDAVAAAGLRVVDDTLRAEALKALTRN
jgi:hypothetical protein